MNERADAGRRWFGLAILCLVGIIASTGQTLVSVLLEPIKADLGFSDAQIGLVTGIAISIVGGLAAFPIAAAADRYGRRLVLACSAVTWSIAALVMGLTESATVFSLGVIGFNLGDAALLPLLYAMVPALFDDERRHKANAILVATLTACAFGVFAIGGLLLEAMTRIGALPLTPWRAVFIVTALAGFIVALVLPALPTAKVPSGTVDRSASSWQAYFRFMKRDGLVVLALFFGLSIAYAAFLTTAFWAPAMLQRSFAVPTADAGILLGWALALSSLVGIGVAAPVIRRAVAARGPAATLRVMIGGLGGATLAAAALPLAGSANMFVGLLGVHAFAMSFVFTSVPLLLQESAPEQFRSRTIAFFPLLALGTRAIALPVIGYASDLRPGDPTALVEAVTVMILLCLPAAAFVFWRTEARYAAYLRRRDLGVEA